MVKAYTGNGKMHPYEGCLLYFHAQSNDNQNSENSKETFSKLVQELKPIEVFGEHSTILKEPLVKAFAVEFAKELTNADKLYRKI